MPDRPIVSEAVFEKIIDGEVMRRLYQDSAYRNAENADEQKAREEEIEREVLERYEQKYEVA